MTNNNIDIDLMDKNLHHKWATIGIDLVKDKKYEKAISVFNELLDLDIKDQTVKNICLWNLGVCQIILERWVDAAYTFSKFLEADPGNLQKQAQNNFMIASHKAYEKRDIKIEIQPDCIFIENLLKRPVKGDWIKRWSNEDYVYNDPDLCTLIENRFGAAKDKPFIFFDIGANVGVYSLYAATSPECDVEVHAFEPNPVAYSAISQFSKTEGVEKKIIIHNIALSDRSADSIQLYTPLKDTPELSRLDGVHPLLSPGDWTSYTINVRRIDDLDLPKPNLIKIDVEDHEYQVIKGAEKTIAAARPIIFFENWYYGFNLIKTFRPLAAMESLGYRLFTPIWKVRDEGHEYFTITAPQYGSDLSKYTLCLNSIDIKHRPNYMDNINIIAIPHEKINDIK